MAHVLVYPMPSPYEVIKRSIILGRTNQIPTRKQRLKTHNQDVTYNELYVHSMYQLILRPWAGI